MKTNKKYIYSVIIAIGIIVIVFIKISMNSDSNGANKIYADLRRKFNVNSSEQPQTYTIATIFNSDGTKKEIKSSSQLIFGRSGAAGADLPTANEVDIRSLQKGLTEYFKANGFKVTKNESWNYTNNYSSPFVDMTFSKNEMACQAFLLVNTGGQIISCGLSMADTELYNTINAQFIPIISKGDKNKLIDWSVLDGNYAHGYIHYVNGPGGVDWLAIKQNGIWKDIADGQEFKCSVIDQYKIPKEVYGPAGGCVETNGSWRNVTSQ